ncbi:cytochrome b5 [Sparassis crispa]|uniref:Cytochrome b5 n=1 Tax=Sparassis crispa TaxID=139825 RepID=A0A401GAJ2_9APHY|nr:cytochrome b5 [Sparassis crispa]GBE79206.1 cytochrome b5 [Sparassis crispa]
MSWILHPEGDGGGRAQRPTELPPSRNGQTAPTSAGEEVPDPVERDRLVSTKQANQPFLGHSQYRKQQEKEHEEWAKRKKEREEKIARGEPVGPEEPDPTEEPEVGCLGLMKFLLYAVIFVLLTGKFITGSYLWELEPPNWRKLIPTNQRLFSEGTLATFDGSNTGKPVYLAIDGDVYDVTVSRATYGPGGPYHMMAGRDAARAFGTGCFATHLTHDLRGLSEQEMKGVQNWKEFYAKHKKYVKVGRVSHPPVDPASPIPEHCDPSKAKPQAPWLEQRLKEGDPHRGEL